MAEQEIEIPLFPLTIVLFPTMVLPILVFEERYKLMINRCLETESDFGVALIKSGREVGGPAVPYQMGTIAHISQVEPKQDDNINISVIGRQRFSLLDITQETPYMMGRVLLLNDKREGTEDQQVTDKAIDIVKLCIRRLLATNSEWVRDIQLPTDPLDLSYLVAIRLPGEQALKQHLLEADSPSQRLSMEMPLLEAEADRLQRILVTSMWLRSSSFN